MNGKGHSNCLVKVIGRLLKLSWRVEVVHTYKEGKMYADWIANYSLSLESSLYKLYDPLLNFGILWLLMS